jgi:hypothetical protein
MKQDGERRKREIGHRWWCAFVVASIAWMSVPVWAQTIQMGGFGQQDAAKKGHVELVSDAVEVQTGGPQVVELEFRVDPGFHINSHTPKDGLLIPTVFQATAGGVKVLGETYPAGSSFRLTVGAGETLDVYQGEFRVGLRVVAPKGASTLTGSLRYQACDNAACFPARTLAVRVALTGR